MGKKKIYGIILFFLFLLLQDASPKVFKSIGAYITTSKTSYIRTNNVDVKNDSGYFYLNNGSELRVTGNVKANFYNTHGDFILKDSALAVIDTNLINSGTIYLYYSTKIWVKNNLINSGSITNEYVIEIGE